VNDETMREAGKAGDLLVRVGAALFIVGALATLATLTPLFIGARPLPTAAYLVSMLMGVGFALALAGLLRSALEQRRQVLRSVRTAAHTTSEGCPPDGVRRP
jgi:hypothetical protein